MRLLPLLWLVFVLPVALRAEDLVTRDGKVYHGYKVLGHDAGFVTIMYSEGGGRIPLSDLPDNLQQKYGYNKAAADAFVQASVAQDRQDRQAIIDEQKRHEQQVAARLASNYPPVSPSPAPETPAVVAVPPPTTTPPSSSTQPTAISAPAAGAAAPMTPSEIDAVEDKISDLMTDVAEMHSEQHYGTALYDPNAVSAFTPNIAEDEKEVERLRNSLMADNELLGKTGSAMTMDDVDAAYVKIATLRKEVSERLLLPWQFVLDVEMQNLDQTHGVDEGMVAKDETEIQRLNNRARLALQHMPRVNLTADQLKARRDQMLALKADIQELTKGMVGARGSRGAYDDKIIDDTTEIDAMEAKIENGQ